jgi:hypothetical protein
MRDVPKTIEAVWKAKTLNMALMLTSATILAARL